MDFSVRMIDIVKPLGLKQPDRDGQTPHHAPAIFSIPSVHLYSVYIIKTTLDISKNWIQGLNLQMTCFNPSLNLACDCHILDILACANNSDKTIVMSGADGAVHFQTTRGGAGRRFNVPHLP